MEKCECAAPSGTFDTEAAVFRVVWLGTLPLTFQTHPGRQKEHAVS